MRKMQTMCFRQLCLAAVFLFSFSAKAQVYVTLCDTGCTFNSFANMASNLSSYMGPGGIIVNVSPGAYDERFTLQAVTGQSAANPVIIQSSTGNRNDVVLRYQAGSAGATLNFAMRLRNAHHFTFKDMSFERYNAASSTITGSTCVSFDDEVDSISFENCVFEGITNYPNSDGWLVRDLGGSIALADNFIFKNCYFKNGYGGITADSRGYIIVDSCVFECSNTAMSLKVTNTNGTGLSVTNNTITNGTVFDSTKSSGIIIGGTGAVELRNNYIRLVNSPINVGLHFNSSVGDGDYSLVANNEIIVGGSSLGTYGIYIVSSFEKYFYHNSILSIGTDTNAVLVRTSGWCSQLFFRNNILAQQNAGLLFDIFPNFYAKAYFSDNNLLYTPGPVMAKWGGVPITNLADWHTTTGFDANSYFQQPMFLSTSDLHSNSPTVPDGGGHIPAKLLDADKVGVLREFFSPSLGAYEYPSDQGYCGNLAIDSVVTSPVSCVGDTNGALTVHYSGATGPVMVSISQRQTATKVLVPKEQFNSKAIIRDVDSPDSYFFAYADDYGNAPGCANGMGFRWIDTTLGCNPGALYFDKSDFVGTYTSTCFNVVLPEFDATGLDAVTVKLDVTTNPARLTSSRLTFGGSVSGITIAPIYIHVGGSGNDQLLFNQARTCAPVEVVYDLTNPSFTDKSKVRLRIYVYGIANADYVLVDNVEVLSGGIDTTVVNLAGNTATDLAAGEYFVTVTDSNGCSVYSNVPFTVGQPDSILLAFDGISTFLASSRDGAAWVTASGGQGPFTYLWDINSSNTGDTITNLAQGSYCVTVTDVTGCSTVGCYTVNGPTCTLTIDSVRVNNISCTNSANGNIRIFASAAAGIPQYSVDSGFTWNSIGYFSNLQSGQYDVLVKDGIGCTATYSNSPVVLTNPSPIIFTFFTQNASSPGASDGGITLYPVGGTLPYSYQWSNGTTTKDLNNVLPGTYTLTLTDANGCIKPGSFTIGSAACPTITVSKTSSNLSCFISNNGAISITATGGQAPYQYSINNGTNYQSSGNFTSLAAANYTVKVKDNNGCTGAYASNPVVLTQPLPLSLSLQSTDVSAIGGTDGTATATVGNGTLPYGFSWSNGDTIKDINGLARGSYCLTVTDANGCTISRCTTVNNPSANPCVGFSVALSATDASTNGASDGAITTTVTAGNPQFGYQWSTGQTTKDINGLTAGSYCLTVTDASSCTFTVCDTVGEPAANPCLTFNIISVLPDAPACFGDTGIIAITVSGGQSPIQYSVDNGSTFQSASLFNVPAGNYDILIRDNLGCDLYYSGNPLVLTDGVQGNATISANGDLLLFSSLAISQQWYLDGSPISGAIATSLNATQTGDYYLVIVDFNGCMVQSNTINVVVDGIVEIEIQGNIWPNPTQNLLNYQFSNLAKDATFELYDITGRLLLDSPIDLTGTGSIHLADISDGMYWVRVNSGNQVFVQKIVVQQ